MIDRQLKREVLDEYVMTELHEITDEYPDEPDRAAFTIAVLICYAWDEIDEVRLGLCLSSPGVDTDAVVSKLRWFAGAGFVRIHCLGHTVDDECLAATIHDPGRPEHGEGVEDRDDQAERWVMIDEMIRGFRYAFWETDPDPDTYVLDDAAWVDNN